MKTEKLYCSICGIEITIDNHNWKLGHNAFPINEGRCCKECNDTIVTPRRLRDRKREQLKITKERSKKNVSKY